MNEAWRNLDRRRRQGLFVVQPTDACADFGLWDGGNLVHHQATYRSQAIALVRLDWQAEKGRVRLVSGEGADSDRVSRVEAVILNDDDGAWLAGIDILRLNQAVLVFLGLAVSPRTKQGA